MRDEAKFAKAQFLTPETEAVWKDKRQNLLEHMRRMERERDEARAKLAMGTPCVFEDGQRKELSVILSERDKARAEVAEMNARLLEEVASYLKTMESLREENRRLRRLNQAWFESVQTRTAWFGADDSWRGALRSLLAGMGLRCRQLIQSLKSYFTP